MKLAPFAITVLAGLLAVAPGRTEEAASEGERDPRLSLKVFRERGDAWDRARSVQVLCFRDRKIPWAGVEVEAALHFAAGERRVAPVTSDAQGLATLRYEEPVGEREYEIVLVGRSDRGFQDMRLLQRASFVDARPAVVLALDKPLYQPGHRLTARAYVHETRDARPLEKTRCRFEVLDPNARVLLVETVESSRWGIASVSLPLSDTAPVGDYAVNVTVQVPDADDASLGDAARGKTEASATAWVREYVLPKLRLTLVADDDRATFLPGETLSGAATVHTPRGQSVAGARLSLSLFDLNGDLGEIGAAHGRTDAQGRFRFAFKLPADLPEDRVPMSLTLFATDPAGLREVTSRSFLLSEEPVVLRVVAEAGRLVPGVDNEVLARVESADGAPLSGALLRVGDQRVRADEQGLARVTVPGPQSGAAFDFECQVVDGGGETHDLERVLPTFDDEEGAFLLRPERLMWQPGESPRFVARFPRDTEGVLMLQAQRLGRVLAHASVAVSGREAAATLDLPAATFGEMLVTAYLAFETDPEAGTDEPISTRSPRFLAARRIFRQRGEKLVIAVSKDDRYEPGQKAALRFAVTDESGVPRPAALGVTIVDEMLYALREDEAWPLDWHIALSKGARARDEARNIPRMSDPDARERALGFVFSSIGGQEEPTVFAMDLSDDHARRETTKRLDALAGAFLRHRAYLAFENRLHKPFEWLRDFAGMSERAFRDGWGRSIRLVSRGFFSREHLLLSAGADGEFDTDDDQDVTLNLE